MKGSVFWLIGMLLAVAPQGARASDCAYEIDLANGWHDAAGLHLADGRRLAAEGRHEAAAERYRLAVELLERVVEHYRTLPERVFDCGPANAAVIAANAKRAAETLEQVRALRDGLSCLRDLAAVDAASDEAAVAYHERQDPETALAAARRAAALAEALREHGLCRGPYAAEWQDSAERARLTLERLEAQAAWTRCLEADTEADRAWRGGDRAAARAALEAALALPGCDAAWRARWRGRLERLAD